ncbi:MULTISPECIES: histone deacetylase family protein [Pseudovibrio]|uniref:histone deacetylase family protein n=1 Tax=Stappiaceae TaxID=2821832 RepID=UPI00236633C5|nr:MULTISPECIES: histone deacetylase family protein [Pseudovibrio]MDD7911189.1 histone deacetylase family protein [Pseudovibrio exalbescens]MDX5593124.1 histone deacetylase family protein [Pseudovibrio sp. SPO723]
MSTLYLHHPSFLEHLTPIGHPERPDRLRAIDRILENERFQTLERDLAPIGRFIDAARVHPSAFINRLHTLSPDEGLVHIDHDTTMSPGTWEAAMRGVGASCQAVNEVMTGKVVNAFASIRPPGHHAERARAMGFCYFNNAAIAARHAQQEHGAERVAIMDFDVHHGNGTQEIFWDDPTVMYTSTHQMPLYPGTGHKTECGEHETIVNAPMTEGMGSDEFRDAMNSVILPKIRAFEPDLIVISAGFDAHERDPLGGLRLKEVDFAWATQVLMDIADKHCERRVVSLLEGGYDLEGLARSVAAHVMTLMNQ